MTFDQVIDVLIQDIYAALGKELIGREGIDLGTAAERLRTTRIVVQAMFNWSKWQDIGSVGFQMQIVYAIVRPEVASEGGFNMDRMNDLCMLFDRAIRAWHAECEAERARRVEESRKRIAEYKKSRLIAADLRPEDE